ncbi:unannotated protein [freshwater metagenome]|uniref:Unannotated protein n=1 Tax=freshwater metagenome TaxID=449393 RepID=A0A6J6WMJ7_9ZZZZ
MVATDVDGIPLGNVVDAVGDHVNDETLRRLWGEDERPAREVLLDNVVLRGARQIGEWHILLVGVGQVETPQPGSRGVDRHRGVHLADGNLVQQFAHVAEMGNRNADLAHFASGRRGVRVVARLRGQVEGNREAGLALGKIGAIQLVGLGGSGVTGVRPHHPRLRSFGHLKLLYLVVRQRLKNDLLAIVKKASARLASELTRHDHALQQGSGGVVSVSKFEVQGLEDGQ